MKRFNGFLVRIYDVRSGETIGNISTKQFKDHCERMGERSGQFVPDLVAAFNAHKERIGDPERVEQVFA